MKAKLTNERLGAFEPRKVYRNHSTSVNSGDFTSDGAFLATAGDDDLVNFYDLSKGEKIRTLESKRHGIRNFRFLHAGRNLALVAGRAPHLRLWDFWDNAYVRFLKGHTTTVTSLDVHPGQDLAISASQDEFVLMWDLRRERPTTKLLAHGSPLVAYDPKGLVFAMTSGSKIHMFDSRNYEAGSFAQFTLRAHHGQMRGLRFSPDGSNILVNTDSAVLLMDSYDGDVVVEYDVEGGVPCFSPDALFVFCPRSNGTVACFETGGKHVTDFVGHEEKVVWAGFNPRRAMLATAERDLAVWMEPA